MLLPTILRWPGKLCRSRPASQLSGNNVFGQGDPTPSGRWQCGFACLGSCKRHDPSMAGTSFPCLHISLHDHTWLHCLSDERHSMCARPSESPCFVQISLIMCTCSHDVQLSAVDWFMVRSARCAVRLRATHGAGGLEAVSSLPEHARARSRIQAYPPPLRSCTRSTSLIPSHT